MAPRGANGTAEAAGEEKDETVPPGAPAAAPLRPLAGAVLRHANKLHATLGRLGHAELAERVTKEAQRWHATGMTIVVAGDIKRGKSSLVNTLVGRPALLPIDADVATSIHLVLRHGPTARVEVTRLAPDGAVTTTEVEPAALVDYASMRGDEALREGVTNVDVILDHPLLERGLVFVDTPGVGGMSRGHRDITMAALQRADALLFTISAQEPISRTELEFLAEASERIDHVVFVVTKSDLNTDDVNARLADENREKLRAHLDRLTASASEGDERASELAGRFTRLLEAPYLLTSAFLADQAARRLAAGRTDTAVRYRERSGFDRIEQMLERSIDAREDMRLANILQLAGLLTAEAESEQRDRIRALDGDPSVADELAGKQRQLEEFASQQARWRGSLATGIQRLQTGAGRQVSRELNLVRNHYRDLLGQATDAETLTATLPDDLERSLHAAWCNLVENANRDFARIVGDLLSDFGVEGMEAVLGDLRMPEGLRELVERAEDGGATTFTALEDGIPLAMQTFTFANIANAAVGAFGIATGGLGLVAYGIGAAISYPLVSMRRKQRQKMRTLAEYNRVINEALFGQEGIAKEFTTELNLRIIDVREQIERLVEERLAQRRKELELQQRRLQALLRAETAGRKQAGEEAERVLAELRALRDEGAGLRAQVDRALAGRRETA